MKMSFFDLLLLCVVCFLAGKTTGGFSFQRETREMFAEYKGKTDLMIATLSTQAQEDLRIVLAEPTTPPPTTAEHAVYGAMAAESAPRVHDPTTDFAEPKQVAIIDQYHPQ